MLFISQVLYNSTVKRRTFYHLSLSVPYVVLIISGVITALANGFDLFTQADPAMSVVIGVFSFFTIAGVIWGPLYTWMVVVMLIWSRGRRTEDVRRLYLLSPVLLACSMGIPVLATDPASSGRLLAEGFLRMNNMGFAISFLMGEPGEEPLYIGIAWLFMAAICLVVGYAFVGIMVWVEGMLEKRGKFRQEETPLPGI